MARSLRKTKPCKNGHTSGRYPSNGHCIECATAVSAAWYVANKEKKLEYDREYRKRHPRNPEAKRLSQWKHKGLPEPTRPAPATCECCGGLPGKRALSLDHDHETGKFRGWLCGPCNVSIGGLGDNLAGVKMAVTYLEKTVG